MNTATQLAKLPIEPDIEPHLISNYYTQAYIATQQRIVETAGQYALNEDFFKGIEANPDKIVTGYYVNALSEELKLDDVVLVDDAYPFIPMSDIAADKLTLKLGGSGQRVYFHVSTETGKLNLAESTPLNTSLQAACGHNKGPAVPDVDQINVKTSLAIPPGKSIQLTPAQLGFVRGAATQAPYMTIRCLVFITSVRIHAGAIQLDNNYTDVNEFINNGLTITNDSLTDVNEVVATMELAPGAGTASKF